MLSKRKLESYRRAEVVAQASRAYMTAIHTVEAQQAACDVWTAAVLDWMDVTGKLKYEKPVRRSRKKYP